MTSCWYCGDTTAAGTDYLRAAHGINGVVEIIVCQPGHGCHDGSIIRHGPGGAPEHRPGQPCPECRRAQRQTHNNRRPQTQVRDRASRLRPIAGPAPTDKAGKQQRNA